MRKVMIIAKREYMAAVRTKAFLIGLVSMPVMMFGSIAVQSALKNQVDVKDKAVALVDRTADGRVAAIFTAAVAQRNEAQTKDPATGKQTAPRFVVEVVKPSAPTAEAIAAQRLELSRRIGPKDLDGFLDVGPDILDPPTGTLPALDSRGRPTGPTDDRVSARYQTNTPLDDDVPRWAEQVINAAAMQARASKSNIATEAIVAALRPVPFAIKRPTRQDPATKAITDAPDEGRAALFLVPAGLAILMLMVVLIGTTPLLQSVFEEKMARIAEVMLGSVRPFELMMGKLLGMVGVSLTTVALYLGGAYVTAQKYGFAEYLPPSLIAWFFAYQILGVLMYGSLFIAIGSACSDIKETQTLITPVMLLAMIPMFTLVNLIEKPMSPLSVGLSFFPFATPMAMLVRQSVPPGIPWWHPPLGMLSMLAMTVACVYAAGRIFRVGLLMQGKGANFAQMAKWVVKG